MVEPIGNPRVGSRTRALADAVVHALSNTPASLGTTLTDGIQPDEPVANALGADEPAPAVVLLDAGVADLEPHVGRWVRTYAGALGASLSGASLRIGVQT